MLTATADNQNETITDYQLRLPGYEGPLDVLLRLIERNQMEITDVSLVTVTSQFLRYVETLSGAPDSIIAGFTSVGTRLAVLKSRSLLPRPDVSDDNDEPSDLARQLVEYRLAREASRFLSERSSHELRSYSRPAHAIVSPDNMPISARLGHYSATSLAQSLRRRLTNAPRPTSMIPRRKLVSLRETVNRILDLTGFSKHVQFSAVVSSYVSRTEVATAFLGVLILVKRETIQVGQSAMFGDIELIRAGQATAPGEIGEEFDGE